MKQLPPAVKAKVDGWMGKDAYKLLHVWEDGDGTFYIVAKDEEDNLHFLRVWRFNGEWKLSKDGGW